ncbi:MAG TPA: YncE family protein [Vicinamibacteria bacterium]|nr:YncE family protein [Vicinamibacteria bacterium]
MMRNCREAPALLAVLLAALVPAFGCAGATGRPPVVAASPPSGPASPEPEGPAPSPAPAPAPPAVPAGPLPGMPPVLDPEDIYSETRPGHLSHVVKDFPERVYVPNSKSNTVDVIDPKTFKIIDHFDVGILPQHVTPSWDLKMLWVLNNAGNTVTKVDPATGKKGGSVRVDAPYNMYYTPDGKYAMVVAERLRRLDFRDPHTMKLQRSLSVPCPGVDHVDFSADGRYFIASCEFGAKMIKVDVAEQRLLGAVKLRPGGMPQDVKLSPDGKVFYVADMRANGVYMIDGEKPSVIGFIPTGLGAHGLYASRDSKVLYVSNRGEGSISLIDFATRAVVKKWVLPGGGSPDMGGVSADGKVLWLAGRYHSEVYAIDTHDGKLLARIPVGREPHGLCIYPQPGRYSLGHTGVFR